MEIWAGSYHVIGTRYFSATGALFHFCEELQVCYDALSGKASYKMNLQNDLVFIVEMMNGGRAVIKGEYQEFQDVQNILQFEIATDQTCFSSAIQSIENLKQIFGSYQGINK